MNATDLADCEESYQFLLDDAVKKIQAGQGLETPYFIAETCYRILACCALLGQADVPLFLERLDRSGTARLYLLDLAASGIRCDPQIMTISRSTGFACALASGNAALAAAIGKRLPAKNDPSWEYEDDFLFFDFLRHLAIGTAAGNDSWVGPAKATLDRWKVSLAGRTVPAQRVCEAMWGREAPAFADAFDALIDRRNHQLSIHRASPSFNAKVFAAEGRVYIEGFAVLELATRLGLPSKLDYPLIPSLGRSDRSRRNGPSPDWLLE